MPKQQKLTIGWREWVSLPELGISAIKAKIDTGARTSSLHAFDVEIVKRRGKDWARFKVHPQQRNTKTTVSVSVEVVDFRKVRSSTGHTVRRPVILTPVEIFNESYEIEITLADRDLMGFRMLLGRAAVRRRFLVDPGRSYRAGKKSAKNP